PVLEKCWFAEALVPRLKFRPYEEREALSVLAEACSASKEYEPRLEVLLDYMVFAGVVVRDGGQIKPAGSKAPEAVAELPKPEPAAGKREAVEMDKGQEQYTLILDAASKRKVVVQAPHVITQKELERVTNWLKFQLIVEDANDAAKT
ncbi:MAG: hypothetical protein NTY01_08090, partial [Verrucomicrobia bacterium]|nr:hypothetical protein [Verrucomicrobiota bacterium]